MDIKQKIFQYDDRHTQAKLILIHTINTVRHCQSFKQSNVFGALCPAPSVASLREAASHVRMSCRLVWASPSFIPRGHQESAFNTTHRSLAAPVMPPLVKHYYFWCYTSVVFLLFGFHILCVCCWFLTLCFMIKIKRPEGGMKRKWEATLRCGKMLHAQMLTTCCHGNGFLQAAGLLLFLNKAFFSHWSRDEHTHRTKTNFQNFASLYQHSCTVLLKCELTSGDLNPGFVHVDFTECHCS